jgi:ribosomal biogenesis protein LAS1
VDEEPERREGGQCREELMGLLERGKEDEKGKLLGEVVGRYGEGVVLTTLDGIVDGTRDTRVMRGALGLVREVLGRKKEAGVDASLRDVGRVKAELGKAWEEMREADGDDVPGGEVGDGVESTNELLAWSLHDEETWVPKPIGMV